MGVKLDKYMIYIFIILIYICRCTLLITNLLQKNVTPDFTWKILQDFKAFNLFHCLAQLFKNKNLNNTCSFEIGAGIKIEDVGQPNVLVTLSAALTLQVSAFFSKTLEEKVQPWFMTFLQTCLSRLIFES